MREFAALRTRKNRPFDAIRQLDSPMRTPHPECERRLGIHVCRGVHGPHRGDFRAAGLDPARSGEAVIANLIGLILAVGIAVYMVAALLFPERF
ncbi:potassium-transporting ATPase subunit F [Nocardia sp. NPDC051832]|uniref:potassium-transporting ATPase subunit F n=1 Tax=Nocardia sp. NPDC051832 TaxID=3155673 RepID=UPI003431F178